MREFADVSHYQGLVNWTDYRREVDVVVINAMDGVKRDPQFKRNRDHTRARGFQLVVYYYYLFDHTDVEEGARAFIELLADIRPHETVCLDIEEGQGNQTHRVVRWQEMVDNSILNRRSWIYTYDAFARDQLDWERVSRGRVRWLARAGPGGTAGGRPPSMPHDVWQYTFKGKIPGVKGEVDLNRFGPTSRMLRQLSLNSKPREDEEDMGTVSEFDPEAQKQMGLVVMEAVRLAAGKDHGKDGHAAAQLRARAEEGAQAATQQDLAEIKESLSIVQGQLKHLLNPPQEGGSE